MSGRTYRIEDIERQFGIPRRNVRYWVSQGILPPPSPRAGPAARYGDHHIRLLYAYLRSGRGRDGKRWSPRKSLLALETQLIDLRDAATLHDALRPEDV